MPGLSDFFAELDQAWPHPTASPIALHLIGSTALMLQTSYQRGTKDSDVLETIELTRELQARLAIVAGPGSALRTRHRMYLEIVRGGIPFLPQQPVWHRVDLAGVVLRHFELRVLDVVDIVVSKLKRLHANDLADIEAMVALGHVTHERLIARFKAAVDMFAYDARAADLPGYVENLHQVERDILGVAESDIVLPSWI